MEKQVQITLMVDSTKKHSVLYKPAADVTAPAITGLYLMKTAFKELNEPKTIVITIAEA